MEPGPPFFPRAVVQVVSEDPDGRFLVEAPDHITADREVVLAAVQRNGRALEFAAETLRADKETLDGFGHGGSHGISWDLMLSGCIWYL